MNTFQLSVVAPSRTIVNEATTAMSGPGIIGYFGIMAGHQPFVTGLKPGVLAYSDAAGDIQYVAITGGFLEASGDHVIVLADAGEHAREIDIDRAKEALERAQMRLNERGEDVNLPRAQGSVDRAIARIKVAER